MKTFLAAAALLLTAACTAKKEDAPQPTAAPPTASTAPVTYTPGGGAAVALGTFETFNVTAPSQGGAARRAVLVRAVLPNGSTLEVAYRYQGTTFPGFTGPILLTEAPIVDNYHYASATFVATRYQGPQGTGTLTAVTTHPPVVSGTYTGPLVAGGPVITLTFTKLGL